ncbi:rod shape-determining protein MreC [Reichenbachiella carrageenanivorans]|uniref:Cell shape-determining protein MreC n=1 Tax=Reichenbachiella carrageenanivorans TaxID=2979869 RepID=A0ABY6D259_9BACT|nr:rod shape-determining protein MreC [Reichenbachiella carrageenanivorans]UXX80213.1 rod shape-determining protein MreC [Reichenbachiella carrageenanivorans]
MERLFQFLYKYRTFILLVVLEGICFWIIVQSNSYQGAKYYTTSNQFVASINAASDQVGDFIHLPDQNKQLAEENARLRQRLLLLSDSMYMTKFLLDSSHLGIEAKVIDNSLFLRNNYLTINKGAEQGVRKGMGVVGSDGVVGQVMHTSKNYATVISVLHGKSMISAHHRPTRTLCSVVWKGENPLYADLEYLPRHIPIMVGDSVSTSGYNSTYPEDQMIGIVSEVHLDDDATFYRAKIKLSTNFYTIDHVYMLDLVGQEEIDSLNVKIDQQYE